MVINEELETYSALLISQLGRNTLPLKHPMATFGQIARRRRALANSEKATSLELPVIVASSGCDFVGLANNHFWRCYLGPWGTWPDLLPRGHPETCSGFAMAGFDMYCAFLNTGFPLKLSAGRAYGVLPVPMGWARVCLGDGDDGGFGASLN